MENFLRLVVVAITVTFAACSSSIEASHLTRADVSVLSPGTPHSQVLTTLGPPQHSYQKGGKSVDVYTLDPDGPSQNTKTVVESVDVALDVVTLGVAEAVLTPVEYATKHNPTNYVVTYGLDDRVESVERGGQSEEQAEPVAIHKPASEPTATVSQGR